VYLFNELDYNFDRYFFYAYKERYGEEPKDLNDLVDGINYIRIDNRLKEVAMNKG
jgi:hypothetical protein